MSDTVEEMGGYLGDGSEFEAPTAPQPSDYDKYRTEMSTSPLAAPQDSGEPYVYNPNKPYCLKHGYGHWTKDCSELNPQAPGSGDGVEALDEILTNLDAYALNKSLVTGGVDFSIPEHYAMYPELKRAKAAIELLLLKRELKTLIKVYKDIVSHDIAGPVKWEVSDRITALQQTLKKGEALYE